MSNTLSFICDLQGKIHKLEKSTSGFFLGYPIEAFAKQNRIFAFFPPEAMLAYIAQFQTLCRSNQPQKTYFALQTKDFTLESVEISIIPTDNAFKILCTIEKNLPPKALLPKPNFLSFLKKWYIITRFKFALGSIVPLIIGIAYCGYLAGFQSLSFSSIFLLIFACSLFHFTTNTFNDYFDWKSGADKDNTDYVLFISGGSRALEFKLISEASLLAFSILGFVIIACIGGYFTWLRGPMILVFGFIAAFCVFFYTAPPIRLSARCGLGELAHILCLGPLILAGTELVLLGTLTLQTYFLGLPFGILITASLLGNEYPDHPSDQRVGKNNLMVCLGQDRFHYGLIPLVVSPFVLLAICSIAGWYPLGTLLCFGCLTIAFQIIQQAFQLKTNPDLIGNICEQLFHLYFSFSSLFLIGILVSA